MHALQVFPPASHLALTRLSVPAGLCLPRPLMQMLEDQYPGLDTRHPYASMQVRARQRCLT